MGGTLWVVRLESASFNSDEAEPDVSVSPKILD